MHALIETGTERLAVIQKARRGRYRGPWHFRVAICQAGRHTFDVTAELGYPLSIRGSAIVYNLEEFETKMNALADSLGIKWTWNVIPEKVW